MRHHPEQKENEIYMGNFWIENKYDFYSSFNKMSWSSKRLGNTPYNKDKEEMIGSGYKPGFITIEDVQSQINNLKWEIENIPCTWNKSKLETIAIYEQMINNRTVFDN